MGNFYTNITLRAATQERVAQAVAGRTCYVSRELDGHVIVADERCDEQLTPELTALAEQLSSGLGVRAVAVMNHDDDVLWLQFFDRGSSLGDEYVSAPGYSSGEESPPTGGDSTAIAQAFGIPERGSEVERILRADSAEYAFAFERHSELFRVLGLPDAAAGVGYTYIADGDLSGALSAEDFLHIT